MQVVESKLEIGVGDRLMPVEIQTLQSYVPKLPAGPVDGRVISIYGGVRYAGGGQIITLNRGSNEGLTVGDTLQLFRAGRRSRTARRAVGSSSSCRTKRSDSVSFSACFPISYALIQRGTQPSRSATAHRARGTTSTCARERVELDRDEADRRAARQRLGTAAT